MFKRLKEEPALIINFVLALLALAVGRGWVSRSLSGDLTNLLTLGLPLLTVGAGVAIRQVVTPATKAVETATLAVAQAATQAVTEVSTLSAGVTGEVTGMGRDIVKSVTEDVVAKTVAPVLGTTVETVGSIVGKVLPG